MVASNGFGAVSYPVCHDETRLELLDSMGEKRSTIKPEGGYSDASVAAPCLYPMISAAIFPLTCQSGPLTLAPANYASQLMPVAMDASMPVSRTQLPSACPNTLRRKCAYIIGGRCRGVAGSPVQRQPKWYDTILRKGDSGLVNLPRLRRAL
jgi:hypothetical protein